MMWKNREKDWYNAERRFIFAASTKDARNEWIETMLDIKSESRLIQRKTQIGMGLTSGSAKHLLGKLSSQTPVQKSSIPRVTRLSTGQPV